ncbi:MAG TPA: gamma-glutamyl-gamma-aminobutyrate hydrolase family protein [Longimicrobiaceae bacterium]|nr:gamma-glutamyl-gamma-aminobutyrate hydrolase family protein [Longimicrobiaceae bacterium]
MRPLIAVTTSMGPGGSHQLPHVTLNVQYVTAVEEPGGTALPLTPAHNPQSIERVIDAAHGLLLSGGEDVDPALYGQEPHPELGSVNPPRDTMEMAALQAALRRGIPVLAICRGVQLLNVALGGTLIQDLGSQRPGPLVHEQEAPVLHRWHSATVRLESGLHSIFGRTELFINSFHHQAIDRVAPGLEATAWAEDGIVEGVEGRGHPWMYGVQWHPERGEAEIVGDKRDPDRRLLWAFVDAARQFMAGEGVFAPAAQPGVYPITSAPRRAVR